MESLLVALNAVVPFLCYIAFGYGVREIGLAEESFLKKLNQLVFKAFFPIMMFCNLYSIDPGHSLNTKFIVFFLVSIFCVVGLSILIVPRIVKENPRRGVIIQALYRSNTVLFMLPMIASIYGDSAQAEGTMVIAIAVPLYNVLAVVILESFRGGKISPLRLLKNILTNPMIAGALAGLLFFFLKIPIASCIWKPLEQFGDLCTPLGMFVLGGTLKFSKLRSDMRCVSIVLFVKMIFIPGVIFAIGYLLGLDKLERFIMLALYATPVAAASFPMATNMGGDGDLAGELVAVSTAISVITLFLWIFILKNIGLI